MAQNFILPPDSLASDTSIAVAFEVLPWRIPLRISFTAEGLLVMESDRLDQISELIQHLATFFNIQNLASDIEINEEYSKQLVDLMEGVRELQSVRQRLTVDMADTMNQVRNTFQESENSRLVGDMAEMRTFYSSILSGNQQLVDLQNIRDTNYKDLIHRLKQINLHVQHSSSCRGKQYHRFLFSFFFLLYFTSSSNKFHHIFSILQLESIRWMWSRLAGKLSNPKILSSSSK